MTILIGQKDFVVQLKFFRVNNNSKQTNAEVLDLKEFTLLFKLGRVLELFRIMKKSFILRTTFVTILSYFKK